MMPDNEELVEREPTPMVREFAQNWLNSLCDDAGVPHREPSANDVHHVYSTLERSGALTLIEQLGNKVERLERALLTKIRSDNYCDDAICAEPDSDNCICQREFETALERAALTESNNG